MKANRATFFRYLYLITILLFLLLIIYGCRNGGGSSETVIGNSCVAPLSVMNKEKSTYQAGRNEYRFNYNILAKLLGYTNFELKRKNIAFAQTGKSISGSIRYDDRVYDNTGFTGGTELKPVRFAAVEVVRNSDSIVLSSSTTDSSGRYSIQFTNTDTPGVYIRVISETDCVLIKNSVSGNAIHAVISPIINDSAGESFIINMDIAVSSEAGGAFNILDVLTDGMTFLSSLTGTPQPTLTAFWEKNSCDGTYFESLDNSIHLLGGCSGDTDEYDDDIILHEFGHYASANFSRDDSPGGPHSLGDNTEDIRLAWSEGWAHFFSSAIRGNPRQVDTILNSASSFEMEGPSLFASSFDLDSSSIYTTNEVAAAAVLWDIFDNTNEAFDALSLGINSIWDIFPGYLILPTV